VFDVGLVSSIPGSRVRHWLPRLKCHHKGHPCGPLLLICDSSFCLCFSHYGRYVILDFVAVSTSYWFQVVVSRDVVIVGWNDVARRYLSSWSHVIKGDQKVGFFKGKVPSPF